jgi:hypothetical protein
LPIPRSTSTQCTLLKRGNKPRGGDLVKTITRQQTHVAARRWRCCYHEQLRLWRRAMII